MGMVVANNISSLFAWRNLQKTDQAMTKSLERLSTGYRINKASDDAAGLAISEKMRSQIRGLNQAVRNAQDGISLIQSAEGAIGEINSILQRMRELATQAASDGLTADDRGQIQKEMDQLAKQITDISNTTQFNTKRILTGEYAVGQTNLVIQTGANKDENLQFNIAAVDAYSLGVGRASGTLAATDIATEITAVGAGIDTAASYRLNFILDTDTTTAGNQSTLALQKYDETTATWTDVGTPTDVSTWPTGSLALGDATTGETVTVTLAASAPTADTTTALSDLAPYVAGSATNGWKASTGGGISVLTWTDANNAIETINIAINTVSGYRANLGAIQNRLEYSIANLQVSAENLTAAESRIRDVDMAAEMANFTKQQVLQQAGVAMLAQANAQPQAILQLLR